MKTFRDNAGRAWSVAINVAAVKRCRALVGVDLPGLVDDELKGLGALLGDPVALVDTLYVLCMDEARERGLTDEDFGRAMYGDAIENAAGAFVEELADFFPDPRVRAGLRTVIAKGKQVAERLRDHLEASLAAIDPEAEARRLIAASTTSRASSASTPDPSPSASST